MIMRTVLAAAAVLAVSTPVMAQEAPPVLVVGPEAPAPQMSPQEAAFSAQAQAFDGRLSSMVADIRTMIADTSTSEAQKRANLESILTAYTPEINTFADQMEAFLTQARAQATDPDEQAAIDQALQNGPTNVRAIPAQVRRSATQAIVQAAAQAQAAPAQPAGQGSSAVAGSIPVQ